MEEPHMHPGSRSLVITLLAVLPAAASCRDEELVEQVAGHEEAIDANSESIDRESSRAASEDERLMQALEALVARLNGLEAALAAETTRAQAREAELEDAIKALEETVAALQGDLAALASHVDEVDQALSVHLDELAARVEALEGSSSQLAGDLTALDGVVDNVIGRLEVVQEDYYAWDDGGYPLGRVVDYRLGSFLYQDTFDTGRLVESFLFDRPGEQDSAVYYLTDNCTGTPYMVNVNGAALQLGVLQQSTGKKLFPVVGFNTVTVTLRGRWALTPGAGCQTITPTEYDVVEYEEVGGTVATPVFVSGVEWFPLR